MDVVCYYCLLDKPTRDIGELKNQVVIVNGYSICFMHIHAYKDDLMFEERQRKRR